MESCLITWYLWYGIEVLIQSFVWSWISRISTKCSNSFPYSRAYLGLSSPGALAKLTIGICRVTGRVCSAGARKGLGGSKGERSGELIPRLRRRGERGARDTKFCSSSPPSSSSRMEGSFFTRPPLLSQSAWHPHKNTHYICYTS